MFKKFFPRAKSTQNTTAVITEPQTTITEKQEESFDIAPLFSMSDAYVEKLEHLFLTMILRVFSEGIFVDAGKYNETRNNNCYAVAAGKEADTSKKLILVCDILSCNITDYSFWEKFIKTNWIDDSKCNTVGLSVGLNTPTHLSGATGIVDINIGNLYLSNMTGWDEKFLRRLVKIGSLLILSRFRDFDEWASDCSGSLARHNEQEFRTMKTTKTAHEIPTACKILVRRSAAEDWMLPYYDSPYNKQHSKEYQHEYYHIDMDPTGVSFIAYRNMW